MLLSQGGETVGSEGFGTKYSDTYDGESTFQEDEDSYLLQQALAAARAIHHVQGVEYDETQEINVLTDIKFVVVTVSLPLGCEFSLHCFVLFCHYNTFLSNVLTDISWLLSVQCSSKNTKSASGYQG